MEKDNKLQDCQKKSEEYLAGWQRSRADFLNYKKEEASRLKELLKYVSEDMILEILPILDNFEKAVKEIPEQGLLQIQKQFQDFLKRYGVEEIKSFGQKFDPSLHEVVGEAMGGESDIIIEETQKGYKLNGKVIRPAKVKIN